MTSTERSSDSEASELKAIEGIESEPESASEAKDGKSLEGIEYKDRSVDGTDVAASLEDFLDDADWSDCGQSTMFYVALANAWGEQVSTPELFQPTFCQTASTGIEINSAPWLGTGINLHLAICCPPHFERAQQQKHYVLGID
jgi:hypothetical protein